MKLKVDDLYSLSLGLADIAEKELPISASLKIQRTQKKVSEELLSSEVIRKKVIEKYKEKDLEDGGIKLKKDKIEDYHKEVNELMNQDVDLDIKEIHVKELTGISIKPKTLMLIESILIEENAK